MVRKVQCLLASQWQEDMVVRSHLGSPGGRERQGLKWNQAIALQSCPSIYVSPPKVSTTSPNSTATWGLNVQTQEPIGGHFAFKADRCRLSLLVTCELLVLGGSQGVGSRIERKLLKTQHGGGSVPSGCVQEFVSWLKLSPLEAVRQGPIPDLSLWFACGYHPLFLACTWASPSRVSLCLLVYHTVLVCWRQKHLAPTLVQGNLPLCVDNLTY